MLPSCLLSAGSDRRIFLKACALWGSSLAATSVLPSTQAAEAQKALITGKSVIVLFMQGGPPQHETFDPKIDQPVEKRTIGGTTATKVPGLHFGSSFPKLAILADKIAVVRNYYTKTQHGGREPIVSKEAKDTALGAIYNRIAGPNHSRSGLPSSAHLTPIAVDPKSQARLDRFGRFDETGGLGASFQPIIPGAAGSFLSNLQLKIAENRLGDRQELLKQLDGWKRKVDQGWTGFDDQATELLLRGAGKAFDIRQEDEKLVKRYDTSAFHDQKLYDKKNNIPMYEANNRTLGKLLLLARRLAEAGCGFISINTEFVWDFHSDKNNVSVERGNQIVARPFDHAVSAFIEDVEARGLSDKILLICCGEMGRTPKINKNGGRDHWSKLAPLLLYGGGLTSGQVIGKSNADGSTPEGPGLTTINLLATIFATLFDYSQVRLDTSLPREVLAVMEQASKVKPIL